MSDLERLERFLLTDGSAVTNREVLAFDLYGTLVDPIAISDELGRVLGESDGREAAGLWRQKQLEYSFRLTAMDRYEDFRWVTSRALDFALASLEARLPDGQAERLVELYDHLRPFPDAAPALRALAGMGYELAVFSNGTPAMIGNCLENSGLAGFFGQRISVDEVRAFKPSPAAYQHAAGRLSRSAGQVRLVTSNAFDSVGASAAGMRTAWVNRSDAPFDTIGQPPDLTVPALDRLPAELAG
ncbi:MAG TPA: haloacid dehalogenase type II [Trebonia sp.]